MLVMVLNFIMASGCSFSFSRSLDFTYQQISHMNRVYETNLQLIGSIDELEIYKTQMIEDYIVQMRLVFGDEFIWRGPTNRFLDTLGAYAEDFFEENYLVLISHPEGSSSVGHSVESVRQNGEIKISRTIPGIRTNDSVAWLFIIELSKDNIPEEFTVNFVTRQERRN